MRYIIVACMLVILTGCVNFAASLGGTFVGNIASDKVKQEMDKKK
jgi:hypothetical protein